MMKKENKGRRPMEMKLLSAECGDLTAIPRKGLKPKPALYALPCHKYRELRARYRPVNHRLFPGRR